MPYGERRDPEIVVRQNLTLPPQPSLQTGVYDRCFVVKRKDERRLKASLKVGGSPFSPISKKGPEEQFTDSDE